MKIKRLSIMGFKSFKDKVDIPFPGGISAVVGPNGCGKSNIVDAIRWAMGEQSAKSLRGRNMEDIIFSGAGDFKPLGMAEVSLVLENGNGSFPAEFAGEHEISVTRRLYRSGESEYLLNNVPCRLKDIHEIFMDTGLGNKSYSIIGQGRIGSIVEQKPEETRMMIEEAAGITRFKKKEAEARRKLELTKDNLNRVEDILSEVQTQIRSLKRQAGKAIRYKAIGQEIRRLELVLNANMYNDLIAASGENKKSVDTLIENEVVLTTSVSGIHSRIENMNLELDEKEQVISRLGSTYQDLKEDFARKESTLESLAKEKEMQAGLEERHNREIEDIRRKLVSLGEEKTLLQERIVRLTDDTRKSEEEVAIVEGRMKGRKELLTEIKEEYEVTRTRVNTGVSKEAGLTKELDYLNKRIAEITDRKARLESEKNEIDANIATLVETSAKKGELRDALTLKSSDIEKDIQEKEQCLHELESVKKVAENELKTVDNELNIAKTRLSSFKSWNENYEGYQVGVRTIMKANDLAARNEGRVLGLVADVIQVDTKYEQAVEAVLADRLQYILVENQDDGKEAVRYLKEKERGRGSFISVSDVNGNGNGHAHSGFPLLKDLITVTEKYKPMVNALMGDIALAENLDQAVDAWRSNGRNTTLVTPDGDLVDKNGIISGGKLGSHGLLAKKREITELEEKVAGLTGKVADINGRLEGISLEEEEMRVSLSRLREEKFKCQDELNELDKVIFQLSNKLDQFERLSERLAKELEERLNEEARHNDALNRNRSELIQCGEKKQREEEFLLQKKRELDECEREFDEIREELETVKMKHRVSMEESKGLTREIERIDNYYEESQSKLDRIAEDIKECQAKQRHLAEREEVLRENISKYYEKLRDAKEIFDNAQQERNLFNAEIRENEKKLETLREELNILKEKINITRMEQSKIEVRMENLVEQVREKANQNLQEIFREYLDEYYNEQETRAELERQKAEREKLGEVNLTAIQEHEAQKERYEFILKQKEDLMASIESIMQAIRKINRTCLERFTATFNDVNNQLQSVFPILFNGGQACLKLTDESNPLESGVLVEVRPPGKKVSHMGLLSGGEKALVAMALLFAIYLIKPSPFCLLDEVDAPLDEANVDRFNDLLKEIKKYSQVLMITHNRRSMEIVDSLFGVTMENAGVSKMVAVNLNGNINN
ncbi:MAG: chromosome segregation protein SMC [Deltaproteobacteria bacterium]|nr:chromosome segregation protein SMC [Deltaproteobacteria bacterium]